MVERNHFDDQPKTMGASALLLRDPREKIILVKPTYRAVWHLPGGLMEVDESPRLAARRETKEELGIDVSPGQLLVVDYKSATHERPACIQFVFDGGRLCDDRLDLVRLAQAEIAQWYAANPPEALKLVERGGPSSRLEFAIEALAKGTVFYLEDGQITAPGL